MDEKKLSKDAKGGGRRASNNGLEGSEKSDSSFGGLVAVGRPAVSSRGKNPSPEKGGGRGNDKHGKLNHRGAIGLRVKGAPPVLLNTDRE